MATTEQIQAVAELHAGVNETLNEYDKDIGQYDIVHTDPYELAAVVAAGALIVKYFTITGTGTITGTATEQLTVLIKYSDIGDASDSTDASLPSYISTNEAVATVDTDGIVTGVSAGTTSIFAVLGGKTSSVEFIIS